MILPTLLLVLLSQVLPLVSATPIDLTLAKRDANTTSTTNLQDTAPVDPRCTDPTHPYYIRDAMSCSGCPETSIWNRETQACQPCPQGQKTFYGYVCSTFRTTRVVMLRSSDDSKQHDPFDIDFSPAHTYKNLFQKVCYGSNLSLSHCNSLFIVTADGKLSAITRTTPENDRVLGDITFLHLIMTYNDNDCHYPNC